MKNKIQNAFLQFIKHDRYLLEAKANERSLTHRLAIHVHAEFPDYHVDCEYNRDGHRPKRLNTFKRAVNSDDVKGVTVFPDIIVHQRGQGAGHNLAVIEAKTSQNRLGCTYPAVNECPCDLCKLRAYKANLGYQYAFFVNFPFGDDLENYTEGKLNKYVIEV